MAATTAAHTKTVLVGDAHQLAPVKARGGMFAQLCSDLPWTQKLSEVWRMRDPDERAASLAMRDGGPAPVRRAVEWYRSHDRLHTGDPIAMAADALAAHQTDVAAGRDALLICDTKEMTDALNRRLHDELIAADAATVTAGRGHHIAKGDVIISRRNDPAIAVYDAADINTPAADPVRNGQRWHVLAVDPDHDRIAARRLDDGARTVFSGDYLHQHIHHGYAVTVHPEGHERFTLDRILAEEAVLLDLVDARDPRAQLWVRQHDTAGLSADQKRPVEAIASSPQLVQPLSVPAGARQDHLNAGAGRVRAPIQPPVLVLAPTGKAVDVAVREGAGDAGYTVAKALKSLRDETLRLDHLTWWWWWTRRACSDLRIPRQLLTATTNAGVKTVLVGDAHQLAPVKARGGMFAQLVRRSALDPTALGGVADA